MTSGIPLTQVHWQFDNKGIPWTRNADGQWTIANFGLVRTLIVLGTSS